MADQQSRGGQKVGRHEPEQPEKHRTQGEKPERPPEGQPGGSKPHAGQTRTERTGKNNG